MPELEITIGVNATGGLRNLKALNVEFGKFVASVKESSGELRASLKELGDTTIGPALPESMNATAAAAAELKKQLFGLKFNAEGIETGAIQADSALARVLQAARQTKEALLGITLDAAPITEGATAARVAVRDLSTAAGSAGKRLSGMTLNATKIVEGADEGTAAVGRLDAVAASARANFAALGRMRIAPMVDERGISRGARFAQAAEDDSPGFLSRAATGGGNVAAVLTVAAMAVGDMAAKFDNLMQAQVGNTSMSPEDARAMRAAVLRNMQLGVPQEQSAAGYRHIQDFGFRGKDADHIMDVATKFGIGTHTDIEETAQTIAGLLKAFNMSADKALAVANTIHFTGAKSDMLITQLEKNSSRSLGLASNYIGEQGMPDVLAMMSALVQHRLNPARADTQVSGMIGQIAAPTPKAMKEADSLGLGNVFNSVGLRSQGAYGVLEQVGIAIRALPEKDQAPAIKALFNNKQGGIGASFLIGSGAAMKSYARSGDISADEFRGGSAWESYKNAYFNPQSGTKAAFAGKIDAVNPLAAEQMAQPVQRMNAAKLSLQASAIEAGEKSKNDLADIVSAGAALARDLLPLLTGFLSLPKPIKDVVYGLVALRSAAVAMETLTGFKIVAGAGEKGGLLAGMLGFGKRGAGLGSILGLGRAGAGVAGAAEGAGDVIGGAGAAEGVAAGGGLAAVGAAAAPIAAVVAGVVALGAAWKTNFGDIQGSMKPFLDDVSSTFAQAKKGITDFFTSIAPETKSVGSVLKEFGYFVRVTFGGTWRMLGLVVKVAFDAVKLIVKEALNFIVGDFRIGLDLLTGHWHQAFTDSIQVVRNFIGNLKDFGKEFVSTVLHWGDQMQADAKTIGTNLLTGLINGIKSAMPNVRAVLSAMSTGVIAQVKSDLGIHSPSQVFHELGMNISQGLADGIDAGTPIVIAKMSALLQHVLKAKTETEALGLLRSGEQRIGDSFGTEDKTDRNSLKELSPSIQAAVRQFYGDKSAAGRSEKAGVRRDVAVSDAQAQLHSRMAGIYTTASEAAAADEPGEKTTPEGVLKKAKRDADRIYAKGIADATRAIDASKLPSIIPPTVVAALARQRDAAKAQATATYNEKIGEQSDEKESKSYDRGGVGRADYGKYLNERLDSVTKNSYFGADSEIATRLKDLIDQLAQQGKEAGASDERTQAQSGNISLPDYKAWLTGQQGLVAKDSAQWQALAGEIASVDTQINRTSFDTLREKFQAGAISIDDYRTQLTALLALAPQFSDLGLAIHSALDTSDLTALRAQLKGLEQQYKDGKIAADAYIQSLQTLAANPAIANSPAESARVAGDISGAGVDTQRSSFQGFQNDYAAKNIGGEEYLGDLQGLVGEVTDKTLKAQIQAAIAKAEGKGAGENIGEQMAQGMVDGTESLAGDLLKGVLSGQNRVGKDVGKRLLDIFATSVSGGFTKWLKGETDNLFAGLFHPAKKTAAAPDGSGGGGDVGLLSWFAGVQKPAATTAPLTNHADPGVVQGMQQGVATAVQSGAFDTANDALATGAGALTKGASASTARLLQSGTALIGAAMAIRAATGGGGQHKSGGLLGGLLGAAIGAFVPGGGLVKAMSLFGMGSAIGGAFADGGDPPVGKVSIIGERGPELFVPRTAGTIIPNHAWSNDVRLPTLSMPAGASASAAVASAAVGSGSGSSRGSSRRGVGVVNNTFTINGGVNNAADLDRVKSELGSSFELRARMGVPVIG